jgi:predicted Zn-dependent protease
MEGIYGLARQYYEAGEYEDTAALCAELLDVAPGYKAPRLLLAHTRFRQGDYAQAETLYRDFVEHGPDKPRARLNLALTLYRQGHVEQSRTVYSNFINENASQHPALVIRARTALALLDEQTGNATSPVNGMLEDGR